MSLTAYCRLPTAYCFGNPTPAAVPASEEPHRQGSFGFTIHDLRQQEILMTYIYYKDNKDEWRWRLKASNGRIIADSGEGYSTEREC